MKTIYQIFVSSLVLTVTLLLLSSCSHTPSGETAARQPLSIVFTANRLGEFEPCGCSITPVGGVEREWNALQKWAIPKSHRLLYFTAGTTFVPTDYKANKQAHFRHKAPYLVRSLDKLGLTALSPSADDFALGSEWLQTFAKKAPFPIISANLRSKKTNALAFRRYLYLKHGNESIVVIGISPKNTEKVDSDLLVDDPATALSTTLKEVQSKGIRNPFVILLTSLSGEDRNALMDKFPQIRITLGADRENKTRDVEYYNANTLFANPIDSGKQVMRLDLMPTQDLAKPFYNKERLADYRFGRKIWQNRLNQLKKEAKIKNLGKNRRKQLQVQIAQFEKRLERTAQLPSGAFTPSQQLRFQSAEVQLGPEWAGRNAFSEIIDQYKQANRALALEEQ